MDIPAGVTPEEGHTGFLHLPSAVPALIFLARLEKDSAKSFSLVDREVDLLGIIYLFIRYIFVGENPSSCDHTYIRTHVPTLEGSRLPTEPPGRPAIGVFFP